MFASAQARADANVDGYAPAQSSSVPSAPAAPVDLGATAATKPTVVEPSVSGYIDKDLSGFGAADDDFLFDVD